MAWWEQLVTFEPPEDRWCDSSSWGEFSRSTTQVKEGTYSGKATHPGGDTTKTYRSWAYGWDLSAYPDSAKFCGWLYCSDVAALGASDKIYFGYEERAYGNPDVYKWFYKADLVTGWNLLSVPLSGMNDCAGHPESMRSRENVLDVFITVYRLSTGNVDFYIDDFFVSTDGNKILDLEPVYQVKKFERYNVAAATNQEYAGLLEPTSFSFKRSLNQVTEASFTFPIAAYSDLPEIMDSVRIYRNGMCIWDGVAIRSSKNYVAETCTLKCYSADYVLQKILDLTTANFPVLLSVDAATNMQNYIYAADGPIVASGFKQQGFGFYDMSPCGLSADTIDAYYTIPKEEFIHPWDFIASEQNRLNFDFEVRPPFVFNYWEPQKGRTIPVKFIQDVHFKMEEWSRSGHDLYPACRALSRGSGASFLDDDEDATASNIYAQLVKLLNTNAKSQTEVAAASAAWVSEYKDPAILFDVELLPGGWLWPFDLGDTATWVVEGTEYSKRIMAFDVAVTDEGEKVKVALQ